jgi:glycosyltransferase involved in cell wall biosynthesis
MHRRPVLARDLPVFREVVGNGVRYFEGEDPAALAAALRTWLGDLAAGGCAVPYEFRPLGWAGSARQLLNALRLAPAQAAAIPSSGGSATGREQELPWQANSDDQRPGV